MYAPRVCAKSLPMPAERPLLSVPLRDLDAGPKQLRATLPQAWLEAQLSADGAREAVGAIGDGEAAIQLTPSGGETYLAQGSVRATISTTCGRCLGAARVPIDAPLTLLVVPAATAGRRPPKGKKTKESEGEFEFDPDEADVATYEGETIVLDGLIREAILLEIPISPLCSDDCAGIRSDPAVAESLGTKPLDPRFAKLAAIASALAQADKPSQFADPSAVGPANPAPADTRIPSRLSKNKA
ncbi:MAG: hypothetical protein NVS3B20_23540 [Polyangiales bacterium]